MKDFNGDDNALFERINETTDKKSSGRMLIHNVSKELMVLARAFRITGNEDMYESMHYMANDIDKGLKEMSHADSMELNDRFEETKKGMG